MGGGSLAVVECPSENTPVPLLYVPILTGEGQPRRHMEMELHPMGLTTVAAALLVLNGEQHFSGFAFNCWGFGDFWFMWEICSGFSSYKAIDLVIKQQ